MDTDVYRAVIDDETTRFLEVLASADRHARVPTCPEWTAADLLWHLAEVQDVWAQVVDRLIEDPSGIEGPERPPDAELAAWADAARDRLLSAVSWRSPEDACWSWSDLGGDVAWVLRRQAHEALIHRVDAELTAGVPVTEPDAALAADGVDELLRGFVAGVPPWASWSPEEATVALRSTDTGDRHVLVLGRMTGTSPDSGRTYDMDAAELLDEPAAAADVEIVGTAWDLDRWLWGRGDDRTIDATGDTEVLSRFRAIVAEATG